MYTYFLLLYIIIYYFSGNLPPETRQKQALLFNGGQSFENQNVETKQKEMNEVLVATDAIGMGLNLSIKRIIFSKMSKFDGIGERKLLPSVCLVLRF